jgi:hypothetical protein
MDGGKGSLRKAIWGNGGREAESKVNAEFSVSKY